MIELLRRYKVVFVAVGIGAVIVVVGAALGRDNGSEGTLAPATTSGPTVVTSATSGIAQPDSDVPAIDCALLITQEEREEALAVFDRPADQRSSLLLSQNEVCGETLASDESVFVRIEPGHPDDFEPGALLLSVPGETVDEVGDAALWFGGDSSGLLSVRKETQLGALHFHVVLGRPDLDDPARREIAVRLASAALLRFPGVAIEPPAPEVVTFEAVIPDRSHLSLYDNLIAKEEAGEWTRGEGLVATLGLVTGEIDASQVLREPDLLDRSATEVIQAAEEYLQSGPEEAAKTEIARLLGQLLTTEEELAQASAPEPVAILTTLLVSLTSPTAQAPEVSCADVGLADPCTFEILLPVTTGVPTDKYSLYATFGQGSPWTVELADLAKQAVLESARKYEELGRMPDTTVLLQAEDWNYVSSTQQGCIVYIGDFLASYESGQFQQVVAREIAFCLIGEHLFFQAEDQAAANWWVRGLANYLSGYVFPAVNFEHENLPNELAQIELSTTLADRTYTNWVFFEFLHGFIGGAKGNVDMIAGFPEGGDQVAALAGYADMSELFHGFEQGLTDADIHDLGPGLVPYEPIAWELPLSGAAQVSFPVPRFGVRRLHIVVPPGQYACYGLTQQVEQQMSWRPGEPGSTGPWTTDLPDAFEDESVLLITTVLEGAQFEMDVIDVDDDPGCEEEPPPESDGCELNVICRASRYFFTLLGD